MVNATNNNTKHKEYFVHLLNLKQEVEHAISRYEGPPGVKRTRWIGNNIPDLYTKLFSIALEMGWYNRLICMSAHHLDYDAAGNERLTNDIVTAYKKMIHISRKEHFPVPLVYRDLIENLGLETGEIPVELLPYNSFFLTFTFELDRPFISKDTYSFYMHDNPISKDKAFKLPVITGSTWKGNLHWAATHLLVEDWINTSAQKKQQTLKIDDKDIEKIAMKRLQLTRLFGDEKGEEPGEIKNVAAYLDEKIPQAKQLYRHSLRDHFRISGDDSAMPHHAGCLHFFATFFYDIDLDVITPLDRKDRIPAHGAIPMECVPKGAKGRFSLLYVPFDLIGMSEIEKEAKKDLNTITACIKEMMLTYGFSAKKASSFGVAKSQVENGELSTNSEKLVPPDSPMKNGRFVFTFENLYVLAEAVSKLK